MAVAVAVAVIQAELFERIGEILQLIKYRINNRFALLRAWAQDKL